MAVTDSKVFIVGGDPQYARMFYKQGWIVTDKMADAHLVQFTGGEDVSPALYGELPMKCTSSNLDRDERERVIFNLALKKEIPMAGICRGGQFLNVMCGGKMWQDVDNHGIYGTHEVTDLVTNERFQVTSTHHQMMREGKGAKVMAAAIGLAEWKSHMRGTVEKSIKCSPHSIDPEIIWYPDFKVLCFQPHPEFHGQDALAERYFNYLYECLEVL